MSSAAPFMSAAVPPMSAPAPLMSAAAPDVVLQMPVQPVAPSLMSRLLETHQVMLEISASLKHRTGGDATSRPWLWPANWHGQWFSGIQDCFYPTEMCEQCGRAGVCSCWGTP